MEKFSALAAEEGRTGVAALPDADPGLRLLADGLLGFAVRVFLTDIMSTCNKSRARHSLSDDPGALSANGDLYVVTSDLVSDLLGGLVVLGVSASSESPGGVAGVDGMSMNPIRLWSFCTVYMLLSALAGILRHSLVTLGLETTSVHAPPNHVEIESSSRQIAAAKTVTACCVWGCGHTDLAAHAGTSCQGST